MDVLLIPGLWLDASSWRDVVPTLEQAGHRVRALTMPGVGAAASDSSNIGIEDWIDALVAEIDATEGDVVLVGHSGGGNVAWGAADRRPERVARVVFVDTIAPARRPVVRMHLAGYPREEIAALCLADPRVDRVIVRSCKPDIFPDARVGCEIERSR